MATIATPISTISFNMTANTIVAVQTSTTGRIKPVTPLVFNLINTTLTVSTPMNNTTQVGVWY